MTKANLFRFAILLVSIIAFSTFLIGAAPSYTSDFYVNDYANVLSDETEDKIMSTAISLDDETTAQVVVLTVESLEGKDIADFAVDTAHTWGIGDKDKDNGVLIVLAIEEREIWVTVGYGLEGTLTDIRTGQLQDQYAVPYYKNNDFDTGTLMLYQAIVNEIRVEEYGLEPLTGLEYSTVPGNQEQISDPVAFALILVGTLPIIPIMGSYVFQTIKYKRLLRFDKLHGTHYAEAYRRKMIARGFVATQTGRHYHGGGGFRGGGGGFRGGGGGFGGGGAGRGF